MSCMIMAQFHPVTPSQLWLGIKVSPGGGSLVTWSRPQHADITGEISPTLAPPWHHLGTTLAPPWPHLGTTLSPPCHHQPPLTPWHWKLTAQLLENSLSAVRCPQCPISSVYYTRQEGGTVVDCSLSFKLLHRWAQTRWRGAARHCSGQYHNVTFLFRYLRQ